MRSWLNNSCLVLDQSWRAVNVVPAHKAICMCYTRDAFFVDTTTYATHSFDEWLLRGVVDGRPIKTVRTTFDAPDIVVRNAVHKFRKTKVNLNKATVCKRDGYRCQYCSRLFPETKLSLDHVVPKCRGGKLEWTNVVASCLKCNVAKGGQTLKQAGLKLQQQPEEPRWSPLFSQRVKTVPASWKKFLPKGEGPAICTKRV